jgi:hypothetical protein
VDVEMLTILFLDEDVPAVRANQGTNFKVGFILTESKPANLAPELTATAGIVIEISMWCTASMANSISRYRVTDTRVDRFESLAVLGFVISKQENVIEPLRLLDYRECVNIELVVLRACNIVLGRP